VVAAAVAAVALVGCFHSGLMQIGAGKKAQRRQLAKAAPAELEVTNPWQGEPRPAKVRVWVDEDFRSQNLHWRAEIEEQIDEANQILIPALGVRLDVAAIEPWPARSAGRSVEEALIDLEQRDPGDGATWVIGYMSSLSMVSSGFEQLGMARLLGHHLVVRGFADGQEREAFARALPDLGKDELEALFQARRRHKQTVILVHEVCHSLGAIHETDEQWIMYPTYGNHMAQLSNKSRELMQITLTEWLLPPERRDPRVLAGRLATFLDTNPWGGWSSDEVSELQAQLRQQMDSAPTAASPAAPAGPGVPAAAHDQFKRARLLAQQGKADAALAELDALVAAYPATLEIRQAICQVRVGKDGPGADTTIAACQRAATMAPDDPAPYLARVQGYLAAGDTRSGLKLIAEVEQRAGDHATVWDQLAATYQALTLVTRAERAAQRSAQLDPHDQPHPVLIWAARTRARYGLPPDARRWRIAIDDEGAYIGAVRELLDLIYAGKVAEARKRAAAAQRRWKNAPGILAARCDLDLRQGDLERARRLCAQAIAAWPQTAWALYLSGVIELQRGRDQAGIQQLRAAIAAEPELGQAYRALGKALHRVKDDAGRAALAEEYQQRFGSPLPP